MLKKMKLNNTKLYTMLLLTITCVLPLIGAETSSSSSSKSSSSKRTLWITFRKDEISQRFDPEEIAEFEKTLFEPTPELRLAKKLISQQIAKFLHDQHTLMQKIKFLLDEQNQALLYDKQNTDFNEYFVKLPHDDEKTVSSKISPKKDFCLDSPEQYSLIIFLVQAQLNKPLLRNVIEKLKPFLNIEDSAVRTYTLAMLNYLHMALYDKIFDQTLQEAQSLAKLLLAEDQYFYLLANTGYLYPLMTFVNIIGAVAKKHDENLLSHIFFTDSTAYTELQKLVEWYQAQEQFRVLYEDIENHLARLAQKHTTSSTNARSFYYFRKELDILDFPMDESPLSFTELNGEDPDKSQVKETELLHMLGAEPVVSSDTPHAATSERRKKSKKPHQRKFRWPSAPTKEEEDKEVIEDKVCVAPAAASSSSSSKPKRMPTSPKKGARLRIKTLNTSAWQYDARVTEWHTNPETALKFHGDVAGGPTEEHLQEIIIRHRLPYVLEDRFQQLAITQNKTVENKKTGRSEKQITLNFPGAMRFPDGHIHYGIFAISLNPANNHVYHRFFHTTPSSELASMLQTCIDKLEAETSESDTAAIPHDDLVFDATHIEENALTVHIVDRYGIEYILFKGHTFADA